VEQSQDGPAISIVELLRSDDAQITALFDRFAAAEKNQSPAVVRDRLIGRICETLSIQRLAEEEVLYPALRASDEKLVFAFLLAGLGITMRIGEIRDPGKPRATRDFAMFRLMDLVRRNMFERSQVLLPFVSDHLSETQLLWLGDDYQQRKARLWTANAAAAPRTSLRVAETPGTRKAIPIPLWRNRGNPDGARLQ
jgi:hemerythrin superfamily protein